jgi:hypothetical protein
LLKVALEHQKSNQITYIIVITSYEIIWQDDDILYFVLDQHA